MHHQLVVRSQLALLTRKVSSTISSNTLCIIHTKAFFSLQTNTFQGILTTDGTDAYAVFIYKCGELEWARSSTVIGIKATSYYRNYPSTGNEATTVACIDNAPNTDFRNLVYKLSTGGTAIVKITYGLHYTTYSALISPENTHKLMRFYMESLILGYTLVHSFCFFFKLFPTLCI